MTKPGAIVIVSVVALVFAGLASWGVYSYLQKETQKVKAVQGGDIVVAAAEIPVGSKLNATMMKMAKWPKESMPAGSLTDTKLLDGRVCIRSLHPNEPITEQNLMPKEGGAGSGFMTYRVPDGHRAVTVGVNEVAGVAGFLAPENRVDVVLTTQIPGKTNGENISKIFLQNIPILAIGQITDEKEGKPVVVPTVTLDLLPEDAERLVLAASKGTLQLLLRNAIDTKTLDSKGATITKVLGGIERTENATAIRRVHTRVKEKHNPPLTNYVEVIKGKERSMIQFNSSP
jgi:pilus assembly protein CpaB